MYYDQAQVDIRCEWGERGVAALAPISDAVIIVDVLSFSTSVTVAVENGAIVHPYNGRAEEAAAFAQAHGAQLADAKRSGQGLSLSPQSLQAIPAGTRIVLPSPNGSVLALAAADTPVFAGCLRNAQAVALAARQIGPRIAVIPAGERWWEDYSLRPGFDDWVGAGAIISYLDGSLSPEASSAAAAFRAALPRLEDHLRECSSGRELIERGFAEDVQLAAQLNVSPIAPKLINAAFTHTG